MEVAKIYVSGTCAQVIAKEPILAGLVGGRIEVIYEAGVWEDLTRTVVFRSSVTKDVITSDRYVEIPPEVLVSGARLWVGFYGTVAGKALPTVWANLGTVVDGTDPSGDTSTDPALPVWAQLANEVDKLKQSGTGSGIAVTGAKVGQTVKIAAVDEKGIPTAWQPEDFPDLTGYARSVNGVKPDPETGDVKITIPDSGGNVDWLDPEEGEVFTSVVNTPDVPAPTLTGITASYTGGDVLIGTALSALVGIVVTAKYSDGTTKTVTDYTLSGSITEGSNTITVTYEGMTTTFTVTGVAEEPEVTLSSISATYTGGNVAVGTAVSTLTGIAVTAHYSDGSTAPVTGYTLSGEIAEGSNTITVSYGGMTTTFTVTGEAEETGDSGLTDEELAALDAMPDAYLSDDGEYIYWNPLRLAVDTGNIPGFATLASDIGEKYALCDFRVNKRQHLDSTGQNFFNGVIPFSTFNGGTAGFIKDETSPDMCYCFRYGNTSDLDLRVGIEDYNKYVNNGNLTQLLYDKFRRLPMKTSDKMTVLEIDETYGANFTALIAKPTVNEYGYYSYFLSCSDFGLALSDLFVFCNYGGLVRVGYEATKDHEWYIPDTGSKRFYFCIPADKIAEPTFENIKNYIVNRGIKIFYAAAEVTA